MFHLVNCDKKHLKTVNQLWLIQICPHPVRCQLCRSRIWFKMLTV